MIAQRSEFAIGTVASLVFETTKFESSSRLSITSHMSRIDVRLDPRTGRRQLRSLRIISVSAFDRLTIKPIQSGSQINRLERRHRASPCTECRRSVSFSTDLIPSGSIASSRPWRFRDGTILGRRAEFRSSTRVLGVISPGCDLYCCNAPPASQECGRFNCLQGCLTA